MNLEDEIAIFERVPTFAALGKQALQVLAIGAETRNLPSGAVLFYAGELADGGYLVQDGSLLINTAFSVATILSGFVSTVFPSTMSATL